MLLRRRRIAEDDMIRLFESTTTVGNAADTNEADLHTFTLPAGRLAKNGDAVFIRTWVQNLNNTNAKRTRVYFGGTTIGDSTAQNFNNVGFYIEAIIFRTGAATQKAICAAVQPNVDVTWGTAAGGGFNPTTPSETLSGTVSIRITGQSTAAAGPNDVVALATTIDYLPAA